MTGAESPRPRRRRTALLAGGAALLAVAVLAAIVVGLAVAGTGPLASSGPGAGPGAGSGSALGTGSGLSSGSGAGSGTGASSGGAASGGATGAPAPTAGPGHPNIVFVLTDDLSMDLLRYMPQVQALEARGKTFNDYFVSDSLCCPSRTSIFTGEFPHNSGVYTNNGSRGGMGAFYAHHDQQRTFNLALQLAGYRTAMMGKYINGYLDGPRRSPVPGSYVPPGWSEWDVAGWGYPEFNYPMNIDGTVHHFGDAPRDYLTNVITRRGVRFIDRSARAHKPFFLELATFAPHSPYVPAPRDAHSFPALTAPRPPSFDRLPTHAPAWLADHPPLGPRQLAKINWVFRRRVQDVQSIDRMISQIRRTLAARHLLGTTYIVFSSDNGLHTGEYRMMPGKLTAFDTDIHVPLVVDGPGVRAGTHTDAMTENVDLADTFTAIGHTTMTTDGRSLLPLLHGAVPTGWRSAVLVEHHHPMSSVTDPDLQSGGSGNPPSYEAMRTRRYLYVEYVDGEREFYDLGRDPHELHNLAGRLTEVQRLDLHDELVGLEQCHGPSGCWTAGHVARPSGLPAPVMGQTNLP